MTFFSTFTFSSVNATWAVIFQLQYGWMTAYLCDSFTESSDLSYSLQILSIRIWIQLEVGLQHLDLLFCESRSDSFCFIFPTTFALWNTNVTYYAQNRRTIAQ